MRTILCLPLALILSSCGHLSPRDFSATGPPFSLTGYFAGRTESQGVLENRRGAPLRQIRTQGIGTWQGDTLHLEQEIYIGTGPDQQRQHRSWKLRRLDEHNFEATANDVAGTIRGEAYGNAFHWEFTLKAGGDNLLTHLRIRQWMYLQPDGRTMLNHTTASKFGIVIAQVSEVFEKRDP